MAASNTASRTADSPDERPESGAGMAHPTVVPTNFDPEEPGGVTRE